MKRFKWTIVLIAVALLGTFMLTACDSCKNDDVTKYTVTYYDGTTVLKTEEVDAGGKAVRWTPPEKEGMSFVDWYVDAGLNRAFDFENETINEDRSLYAGYAEAATEDTRDWAIVGFGSGDVLSSSNWGKVIADIHKLTKTADENKYSITLDLYKNDQFQFATDSNWMNQRGVGYIGATNRSMTVGGETVTVFSGGGGIGETADKQKNVVVEYTGNYTLTLTTFPDEDYFDNAVNNGKVSISNYDTITWKYNGPAAELSDTITEFYIKGQNITQWADMYNDATQMARIGSTYTLTVFLKQGDMVMFTSRNVNRETGEATVGTQYINSTNLDDAAKEIFNTAGNNIAVKTSGEYTFTYDAATEKLSATVDTSAAMLTADYYIDGSFGGLSWNQALYNPDYKFTINADGLYELNNIELAAGDEIIIQSFTAGATAEAGEKLTAYNFRYYRGTGGAFEAANADSNNFNIAVVTAGTYNIEFDAYAKIIKIVPADMVHTVYIKGSFAPSWKITDEAGNLLDEYKLTQTEDGIFEITMTVTDEMVAAGKKWECMLMLDTTTGSDGTPMGVGYLDADSDSNVNALFRESTHNIVTTTAGTYRIVFNLETNKINIFNAAAAA